MDQFVEVVKEQLEEQGLTVRELAERAGMGYPYLYRVLKGDQSPTMKTADRIAEALGLSLKITR